VVIVRVHRDAAVIARIRAELEANDWRVRELGPDSNSARAPLASLVSVANARAALRMQPERPAIELWVASDGDAPGGGEVVSLPGDEHDDSLLAVRATEALRARGLRLPRRVEAAPPATGAVAPIASAGEPTAAAPGGTPSSGGGEEERKAAEEAAARAAAEARARELAERERADKERIEQERLAQERAEQERIEQEAEEQAEEEAEEEADEAESETSESGAGPDGASLIYIELGPAMAASASGTLPAWAAWANVRLQPSSLWSVSALGFVPFAGGTYEREQRTGYMRSVIVGLCADLHGAYRGIELSAGAGGAFLITNMRGETAEPGYQPRQAPTQRTGAVIARLGVQLSLSRRFRISGRGVFGFGIPELEVTVDPGDGGPEESLVPPVTWGRPFVLAAIALEFGLPEPAR
jgi:hypothetical protein